MLLLFDAGNTRLKWALAGAQYSMSHSGVIDYQGLRGKLAKLYAEHAISTVAISSVAGERRNAELDAACQKIVGRPARFARVSPYACGVKNAYIAQDRLGVDRWVAALGLSTQKGINRVIVDAGTAVTVDLLDAENVYCGGVILPGVKLMHDSLVGETAGIYSEPAAVRSIIGKTTIECVNAGARFGLVGAIDRVIDEFTHEIDNNAPWQIAVCGGDGAWLYELMATPYPKALLPDVIFQGLLNMVETGALE